MAEAIAHLTPAQGKTYGKPLLITMLSTQGTLQKGQAYWLSYDASAHPAAFDCQGFSTSWGTYHMAQSTNANLGVGQVSCWGMQAIILADGSGRLHLYSGGVLVADIAPLQQMDRAVMAADKFDRDLSDGYKPNAGSDQKLASFLASDPHSYSRYRRAAKMLEEVARYKPFIFRYTSWVDAETVLATLISYLRNNALNTSEPFGAVSDYPASTAYSASKYDDYQTSATIIRALYAYGSVSGSLVDFKNISDAFMRDVSPVANVDWSTAFPNRRMQIMWVIARRYREGLETRTRLDAAVNLLLAPVLREQMTDPSEWVCGPRRGWGGWIHGPQALGELPDKDNYCLKPITDRNEYYKQWMSYHLFIVQGLAESYRLLERMQLLNAYPFFRDNAPWNLLAAAAWVYQLSGQTDSAGHCCYIFDRWNDPAIDGTPQSYGTAPGVQTVYEVLRSFDVPSHMPYYANYPQFSSPTWTYAQLQARILDPYLGAVGYADAVQLFTGSQIYSDALYWQFGSGHGYGKALDNSIF